ncbi:hypothetical protein CspeluHIS016_0803870 [Cutaneotrichosporon spelunceum]|uniref:Transferase family-domain-containing protein n=1 Tax=Cutaneotrichosporon spelunceum TaxID=1672016 RepID=A0AAD3YE39_9TREE|nr:hypothetical protein CspeluHIS016_0803870 [Cutaneotrichosporon spelunceum]
MVKHQAAVSYPQDNPEPEVLSTELVLPASRSSACTPVPLISASSVAAPYAQCLLLYDAQGAAALDRASLSHSLSLVLSAYPQLAGRLRLPSTDPSTSFPEYTKRFLRPWIEYGSDDPGFLLTFERRSVPLAAVLPAPTQWERVYDARTIDFGLAPALAPNLAPSTPRTEGALSGAKITLFDGGAALVVGTSHVLADAGALGTFLQDWAEVHALSSGAEDFVAELVKKRRLDWAALDGHAAGDLNASAPDPMLESVESELDVLRYDAWVAPPSTPLAAMAVPDPAIAELDAARGFRRGAPPPWELLGSETARTYILNWSAGEVERITARARLHTPAASANDALAAHLWRLITRARGIAKGEVEFTMACDVRRILQAEEAPGCFNVCLGFNAPAEDLAQEGWPEARIRRAVESVSRERVAAWLHRRAHDLDLRREMICFPGVRSVCATNWARSGVCTLDFGGGAPVYTHNLVPAFGGYATILKGRGEGVGMGGRIGGGEKWYEPGVDVMLWLEESAMARLVADPTLRG